MNRKPLINKDIIKKGLIAGTDGDEGYRADAAGDREPQRLQGSRETTFPL
jgi:hypothetical protein